MKTKVTLYFVITQSKKITLHSWSQIKNIMKTKVQYTSQYPKVEQFSRTLGVRQVIKALFRL